MASVAATILHKQNVSQMPVHRGLMKGRSKNHPHNRVGGQSGSYKDYFDRTHPV
jgi:hypothetical protein